MAHRCIGLANRGVGLVSRQFRATTAAPPIALEASTLSLSQSNHNDSNNSSSLLLQQHRSYASSSIWSKEYAPNPLDAFRDPVDRGTRMQEKVGRQWSVKELRRKSFEDLHKLWYVLYKEKNMLLTEQQLSRRRQLIFPQPERFQKVQKSMGAIRQVLGERKRAKVAAHLELQQERELAQQMTAELEDGQHVDVDVVEEESSGETTK